MAQFVPRASASLGELLASMQLKRRRSALACAGNCGRDIWIYETRRPDPSYVRPHCEVEERGGEIAFYCEACTLALYDEFAARRH